MTKISALPPRHSNLLRMPSMRRSRKLIGLARLCPLGLEAANRRSGMRFSLLGPLAVTGSSGGQVGIGGPRLRVLLAVLLLRANVPVSADELAEIVWDGCPPPGAVSTLRTWCCGGHGFAGAASGSRYLSARAVAR
jgi:hypothetical protein